MESRCGYDEDGHCGSGKEKGRLERRPSVEVLRDVAVYGR